MWIFLSLLAGIVCLFMIAVMICDSNRFVTVNYRIEAPGIKRKTRLVLLADLHNKQYGKDNEKLLAAIEAAAPDLVVSAGDLITSSPGRETVNTERFVRTLSEKYPFYYGNGNHEYRIYHDTEKFGSMGASYREALERCDLSILENESVELPAFGIRLTGLDLSQEHYRKFKDGKLPEKTLEELIGRHKEGSYTVLLAHNPAFFDSYAAWGAELTLSGHVHGGVMRLPYLGGVLSTSLRLFPKYDGGMFQKDGKTMIISRGLGSHTIPIRIFNPAELVVIDLEPGEKK